jgi:ubiquinone/menaquinone biosynthesis C-methylase UbiE
MSTSSSVGIVEAFDAWAPTYDDDYLDPQSLTENAWIEEWLCRRSTPLLVDLGCGTGLAADLLTERVGRLDGGYLGVDLSAGMLAEAQRKHPSSSFLRADMARTRLQSGVASSLTCLFALQHATDPFAVADEAYRLLDRRGWALFVVKSHAHTGGLREPDGRQWYESELRRVLHETGFEAIGLDFPSPRFVAVEARRP